jgi:hypothetical protein
MHLIYLAGPYRHPDLAQVARHIQQGQDAAVALLQAGLAPYCPWLDLPLLTRPNRPTVRHLQTAGLRWLRAADAVYLLPGWPDSSGTYTEVLEAVSAGLGVWELVDTRSALERARPATRGDLWMHCPACGNSEPVAGHRCGCGRQEEILQQFRWRGCHGMPGLPAEAASGVACDE